MKVIRNFSTIMLLFCFTAYASAVTINVPGDYTTIQQAIDASSDGDLILVGDNTYNLSTTISITKGVTVRSVNGATTAIIDGTGIEVCFVLNHLDAIVDGFTIQNAFNTSVHGGGARIEAGTIQNCIIQNNEARDGGGVAIQDNDGYVFNCIIRGNTARYGGGIRLLNGGEVRNCLITKNTTTYIGGGINIWNSGSVYNCTVTKNTAPSGGGGGIRLRGTSTIKNNIFYYNINDENYVINSGTHDFYNNCTTPALLLGVGNITSIPSFESLTAGSEDYHLSAGSGCIDHGYNLPWMNTSFDLDGYDRIYNSIVDMGCYEFHTPTIIDSDGDGISDAEDDFPNDPAKAFINKFPAHGYNSLAYEDLWPGKGDYDFNDVVVDYKFITITNASNHVVYIKAQFILKASGAYFQNGFGFNLPTANQALVNSLNVNGYDLRDGYITLNSNGTESGQSKPTIIVTDNMFNNLPHPGIGTGVNTENWAPFVPYDTLTVMMIPQTLTYNMNDFKLEEWNPFIIVNKERGKEVHLIDKEPTDLANHGYFGTWQDVSDPGTSKYYRTLNNLPWAINIADPFEWPREKIEIPWAYYHFIEWAESSGSAYPDWYMDYSGYRNNGNLYNPF